MRYSDVARRVRLPLGFVLGILYLAFVRPTPLSLALGAGIALVGVLIRAWAAGHILKNERLATAGPYAHTRNPLYFGSFLIGAGFAVAAHWALLLVVIAFWVLIYAPTMERERETISTRFAAEYERYAANVPAFVPRLTPWRGVQPPAGPPQMSGAAGDHPALGSGFSIRLYIRHGEWKAGITYVLVLAWLVFRTMTGV